MAKGHIYALHIREIKQRYANGEPVLRIAKDFEVAPQTIRNWLEHEGVEMRPKKKRKRKRKKKPQENPLTGARKGKRAAFEDEKRSPAARASARPHSNTHAGQVKREFLEEIFRAYEGGTQKNDIASKFGVSPTTIFNWLKKGGYVHSGGRGRYPKAMQLRAKSLNARGWPEAAIAHLFDVDIDLVRGWIQSPDSESKKPPEGPQDPYPFSDAEDFFAPIVELEKQKSEAPKKKKKQLEKQISKKKRRRKGGANENPARPKIVYLPEPTPVTQDARPKPGERHVRGKWWSNEQEEHVFKLLQDSRMTVRQIYDVTGASRRRQLRVWSALNSSSVPVPTIYRIAKRAKPKRQTRRPIESMTAPELEERLARDYKRKAEVDDRIQEYERMLQERTGPVNFGRTKERAKIRAQTALAEEELGTPKRRSLPRVQQKSLPEPDSE